MIKLDAIKPWYTLAEAADRLTRNTEDAFTAADVVQLVNERRLAVWMNARDRYAVHVARVCTYYCDPEENPIFGLLGRTAKEALEHVPDAQKAQEWIAWKRGPETLEVLSPHIEILTGEHQLDLTERDDAIPIFGDNPRAAKVRYINGVLLLDDNAAQSGASDGAPPGALLQLVRRRADCAAKAFPTIEDFEPDDGFPTRDELLISNAEITRFEQWYLASESSGPEKAEGRKSNDSPESASDDWRAAARRIADKIALARHQRGERQIPARSIVTAVAQELAKDPANHGNRGPRAASSIRKFALVGWTFCPPTGANGANGENE